MSAHTLQGVVSGGPDCTCGTADGVHAVDCMVTAWATPTAMATDGGEVFCPDSADEAAWLAAHRGARPLRPTTGWGE